MKIPIDGTEYELPDFSTITLDEAIILFERTGGMTLDKLEQSEGFNPGLIKGLLHIAIARERPAVSKREIDERLGKLTLTELGEAFENAVEDDDSPPAESPPTKSDEPSASSGESSNGGGDTSPEVSIPSSTGPPASDTGFTSFHSKSEA